MEASVSKKSLVIFGISNIISDLVDAALSNGIHTKIFVLHDPENVGSRDMPLKQRTKQLSRHMPMPAVIDFRDFQPGPDEIYLLGPTTPTRRRLACEIEERWNLSFHTLVHKAAYVSPMAQLSPGVFVGANSIIAPGAVLSSHVFINRGVTVGHDTRLGAFSRVQAGANLGGLSEYGEGVTVGLGATVVERLRIGSQSVLAAGAVVLNDVPESTMVAGVPATVRKTL